MSGRAVPSWRPAEEAMSTDRILITPIVAMELLYTAIDEVDFALWERRFEALREAPLDRSVVRGALGALRELASGGGLAHRLPLTDALIAAAAAERGVGVLHHDPHFDRLAEVLDFESRWLPERRHG